LVDAAEMVWDAAVEGCFEGWGWGVEVHDGGCWGFKVVGFEEVMVVVCMTYMI
jgi:hypothetical protein